MEILTIKKEKFEKIEECAKKMGELVRGCRNQTREEDKKLRELIKQTQGKAREYSELLNFSSNLVNGSLSILWSATQGIFKSYGRDRNIHESYHPSGLGKDRKL